MDISRTNYLDWKTNIVYIKKMFTCNIILYASHSVYIQLYVIILHHSAIMIVYIYNNHFILCKENRYTSVEDFLFNKQSQHMGLLMLMVLFLK